MKRQIRTGFTLVELLVVMALLALLATMAIAFFPNATSAAREARAAQAFQGALQIAKTRALRDQAPRGLRLWIRQPDGGVYTPNAWVAGTNYNQLDAVMFNNVSYRCTAVHLANVLNQPGTPLGNGFWRPTQLVTECEYIEQPNDVASTAATDTISSQFTTWVAGQNYPKFSTVTLNGVTYYNRQNSFNQNPANFPNIWRRNSAIVQFSTLDLTGGTGLAGMPPENFNPPSNNNDTNAKYWVVQPGDYLEVKGGGLPRRIETVFFVAATNSYLVAVTPPFAYPLAATTGYRIMRAPRLLGDEPVKLPDNTLIDLDTNQVFGNPLPVPAANLTNIEGTTHVDILFAPNGSVVSKGLATSNIHLWVRSPNPEDLGNVFRGDPTIVSIFVRTGFIGAFSPDPVTAGLPYNLVN